jgi:hypothetical protein
MVADALKGSYGDFSIRYAMVIPAATCLIGGLLMLLAIRYVERDLVKASPDRESIERDQS